MASRPSRFEDLGAAFVHGLTLRHRGKAPEGIPENIAYYAADLIPFLLGAGALRGVIRGPGLLKEGLRWGLASGAQAAASKDATAGEVLSSAAIGGALPPVFGGGAAGLRLLGRGARNLATRYLPVQGARYRYGPMGGVMERLFGDVARAEAQQQPRHLGPLMGELMEAERAVGADKGALRGALGLRTSQLGRYSEAGTKLTPFHQRAGRMLGKAPEEVLQMARQKFAQRAGIKPELVPVVERLRSITQRIQAGEQGVRRYEALRDAAKIPGGAAGLTGPAREATLKAIRGVSPEVRQQIFEKIPIKGRFWESYVPRGESARYIILAEGTPPWAERPLASTHAEAIQKSQEIAQKLGIDPAKVTFERIQPDYGEFTTRLSRPAFWQTVDEVARKMGTDRETALEVMSGALGIRRPLARGKFVGAQQHRKGLLPDVPPEQLWDALSRRIHQSARFRAFQQPLKELSRVYPAVEQTFGGPQSGPARYLDRYMRDVAGQPTQLEKTVADGIERMASVPGPFQPIFQKYAGDEYALRKFATTLRAWQAMSKLGFNLSAPVANLAGGLNNLNAKVGPGLLTRAAWEVVHNPKKWAFLNVETGIQAASLTKAGLLEEVPRGLRGMVGASMALFGLTERWVRQTSAVAGYLKATGGAVAREGTPLYRKGVDAAWQMVLGTQFHYGKANLPQWLRGPVGQVLGQFKPFLINEMAFILNLTPREAFRFFTTMGALTGLGAIPLVEPVDEVLYNTLGISVPGAGLMREARMKHPRLAAGLPGLAGFDIGANIGVAEAFLPTRASDLLGPTVSDVSRIAGASRGGEPVGITAAMTVRGLRGSLQALDVARGGAVRQPASRELLYRTEGYQPVPGRTPAEARRRNVPELTRSYQNLPRPFRREMAGILPPVRAAQQEQGKAALALLLGLGFQPTGLKATRAAQRRVYELQREYRKQERRGVPRTRRRFER